VIQKKCVATFHGNIIQVTEHQQFVLTRVEKCIVPWLFENKTGATRFPLPLTMKITALWHVMPCSLVEWASTLWK
jgi:hypothetical protein